MSTKAKQPAAGKRKQAQTAAAAAQPHSDASDGAAGSAASASGAAKLNRRASKKAKLEASAAAEAAAEAEQARKESRPLATQKREAQRQRASRATNAAKEEEERELENFLFGNEEALLKPLVDEDDAETETSGAISARKPKPKRESKDGAPEDDGEIAFEIDTTGAAPVKDEKESEGKPKGKGRKGAAAAAASAAAASAASDAAAAPQAAWNDADDASRSAAMVDLSSAPRLRKLKTAEDERFISGSEYSRRLRAVFTELNPGTAAWATLKPDASDADITSLLLQSASAGSAVGGGSGRAPGGASRGEALPSTTLDLLRLKDANVADPSASILSSVRFHPNAQLLLTAGLDKMIRLFQIDGVTNTKVQGVWLEDLPIHAAEWLPSPAQGANSAGEIIATGRRSHFYSIDVESSKVTRIGSIRGRDEKSYESMVMSPTGNFLAVLGNDGYTLLLDAKTKMLVASLKQNGSVRGASFSSDGSLLLTTGDEGTVYGWDVGSSRKCLFKHADHGSISNTALAVAPSAQANEGYYACGAESGVVNLYNRSQLSDRLSSSTATSAAARMLASASRAPPMPLKSVMNLTTPIDLLRFNHDSSLLLMASRRKKDACKLLHVPSGTVFANWPTSSTPLHYLTSVDFSPNSGLMALGNDRGRVLLYRLTHYPRA